MNVPEWLNIIIRSTILVFVLFVMARWLGKKQLSHLSFFEYIAGITIGSIAAEISTGLDKNFMHGLYSMIIWTAIPFFGGLLAVKNMTARKFIEGTPTIVVNNGKIHEDNVLKEQYSVDELLQMLRKKDVFNVADVEFAILETNGELNVLLKKDKQPLTPTDIQLQPAPERVSQVVIKEGKVIDNGLAESGYTRGWMMVELEKMNVALDNVYLGQIDSYGKLTVDIYDDKVQIPTSLPRQTLLSTMKKCQADLEMFSLDTDHPEAKQMYAEQAKRLMRMIEKSEFLLRQ